MNVVLIGYRGSGKSAVGRTLARRLGKIFIDTDAMVQERTGHSIRHIFEQKGEHAFREYESRAIQGACQNENAVISVGGGAVLDPANASVLKNAGRVFWLRASPEVLFRRIQTDKASDLQRPPLTPTGGLEEVAHVLSLRAPMYESLADHVIDTDQLDPEQAVERIIQWLSD